jgi:hypothetical protein
LIAHSGMLLCYILKLSVPVWVVPMWNCCAEWGYITSWKNKQKLYISSEGPSSTNSLATNSWWRAFARNIEFLLVFSASNITTQHSNVLVSIVLVIMCYVLPDLGWEFCHHCINTVTNPQFHLITTSSKVVKFLNISSILFRQGQIFGKIMSKMYIVFSGEIFIARYSTLLYIIFKDDVHCPRCLRFEMLYL